MDMTTIQDLKRQLHIELDYTSEDIILQHYLNVAEKVVNDYLNYYTGSTSGVTGNTTYKQGVLLYAAHLYVTRQPIAYGQPYEIPLTFKFMLDPMKEFIVN
jgi:hypothetical protein